MVFCCVAILAMTGAVFGADAEGTVRLYIDADRSGAKAAGDAIEWGLRTALSEVGDRLGGFQAEIVPLDHRGNSRRSLRHLETFARDDRALALFAGLHSPPLLENRDYINRNEILVLDPWAAAGPITRPPEGENWIFRLSIDDARAGYVIAREAVAEGFRRPYLLLEDTGWGKSNETTMTRALAELGVEPVGVEWFNWNLGATGARIILRKIADTGADVVFLVANAPEGKTIAAAMAALPRQRRLPLRSHWGITGGDFPDVIDARMRAQIDLLFLQTRFSFIGGPADPFSTGVLAAARQATPIRTAYDIKAPTGFVHAYDLTRLLIAAVEQTGLRGDVRADRRRLRAALEGLEKPVRGLIKTYVKPFGPYSSEMSAAHEALGIGDFVMGRYGEQGEILLPD